MTEFNPNVAEMFMWKWTAEIYAWRARQRGYDAKVEFAGNNWIELGGRWTVELSPHLKLSINDELRCGTCCHIWKYDGSTGRCPSCGSMAWTTNEEPVDGPIAIVKVEPLTLGHAGVKGEKCPSTKKN